jgi:hypothetical protein
MISVNELALIKQSYVTQRDVFTEHIELCDMIKEQYYFLLKVQDCRVEEYGQSIPGNIYVDDKPLSDDDDQYFHHCIKAGFIQPMKDFEYESYKIYTLTKEGEAQLEQLHLDPKWVSVSTLLTNERNQ